MALTDIPIEYSTQLRVPLDLPCKAYLELRQGTQSSSRVMVMPLLELWWVSSWGGQSSLLLVQGSSQ